MKARAPLVIASSGAKAVPVIFGVAELFAGFTSDNQVAPSASDERALGFEMIEQERPEEADRTPHPASLNLAATTISAIPPASASHSGFHH
jgi:hypothetical protein